MPQYQGVWTVEQQAQALTNQQWVTDPNFKNTTLLLQADGTGSGSQNQTFLDGSTNNFFITRNGNTTQGSFSPFSQAPGYWGNYMTSGYLTTAANAGFALSGDFTVECWVYSGDSSLDSSTRRRIFHTGGGDVAASLQLLLGTSAGNSAVVSVLNNGWLIDGTINVVTNSWNHVAVTRSGTSLKLFVNGAQSGTTATTSQSFNSGTSNTVYIGANSSGNGIWQGYISNLRVIVGTAIYTAPFTPPTTPFATGTTNQQLLVCYNNNFNDANTATTAKTITVNSTPSVQAFGPFAPALQWTPDVVGGSGYFDGTGDYITAPNNTALQLGSGDFTIEGWYYPTNSPSQADIFSKYATGSQEWVVTHVSPNLDFYAGTGGASWTLSPITFGAIKVNQWNHFAVCRSGNTFSTFLNGVRGATTTNAFTIGATSNVVSIGSGNGSNYVTGYMSNCRVVKGTAVYNVSLTSITVPTAPFTAITNTSLLLNYTNAGIYDGKMGNVLETVGDAQVSTSVVKYGSGSMKFDGSGDYLTFPVSASAFQFSTGAFTVEFWYFPLASLTNAGLVDLRVNSSSGAGVLIRQGDTSSIGTGIACWAGNPSSTTGATQTGLVLNQWNHIAATRDSLNYLRVFINGVSGTAVARSIDLTDSSCRIAAFVDATASPNAANGFIDDLRITKGIARYIANFTPPQQALPRQ